MISRTFGLVVASTKPPWLGFLHSMQARGDEPVMNQE
jgi:hypothetical protein